MASQSADDAYRDEVLQVILDSLTGIHMFDALGPEELETVAGYMNYFDVFEGDAVLLEGEKGDYVCFVAEGVLEVYKTGPAGDRTLLTTLPQGRSIGEMAVIDNFPRSATVIAREKARLVTMTRNDFERLLDEHPRVGVKLLKGVTRLLSINLRKTSTKLADSLLPVL